MSNATVELAKYNLQLNRKAYKTYTDLIEITKTSIKDFRGTELSKIAYINIATLTDILDNLKIEAEEYTIEMNQEEKTDVEEFEEVITGHGKTIDREMN